MKKPLHIACLVLAISFLFVGCSKPPYDAKQIDQSELDSPAQKEGQAPVGGGGKALSSGQW